MWPVLHIFILALSLIFGGAAAQDLPAPVTAGLAVHVDGEGRVPSSRTVEITADGSTQLTVYRIAPDGQANDVTQDALTKYLSLTPWALDVSSSGLVTTTGKDMSGPAASVPIGAVMITHGDAAGREVMSTAVTFKIKAADAGGAAGPLRVQSPTTTLRTGETVQLVVHVRNSAGELEVVDPIAAGVTFFTTSESALIPEPDGRVTCIGTHGRPTGRAIVGVKKDQSHVTIEFDLIAAEPRPGLTVSLGRDVLQEGEMTDIRVYGTAADGDRLDLTEPTTGTRYRIFAGHGRESADVVEILGRGILSAHRFARGYQSRKAVIFVRNGDRIGWVTVTVKRGN